MKITIKCELWNGENLEEGRRYIIQVNEETRLLTFTGVEQEKLVFRTDTGEALLVPEEHVCGEPIEADRLDSYSTLRSFYQADREYMVTYRDARSVLVEQKLKFLGCLFRDNSYGEMVLDSPFWFEPIASDRVIAIEQRNIVAMRGLTT